MPLVVPILKGPLTEWSDTLLVEGSVPGATILARAIGPNPRDIAKGLAAGGRDRLPLLPGITLQTKDQILIKQSLGPDESDWTPDKNGTVVGAVPTNHADLPPLSIKSRAWECGARVWVKGATPGAQVVVTGPGGVLASGRATEGGDARLELVATLPGPGNLIDTHQEAPPGFPPLAGVPKVGNRHVEKLPIEPGEKLPAPSLGGAAVGCDPAILIASVFDGAEVTILRRSTGTSETKTFDYDRLSFILATALASGGDKLEIVQTMPRCRELLSSEPLLVDVAPAAKPGTPVLLPPCADSVDILVDNLAGGALVTLTYQSQDYRGMVPPTATSFTFRLAPLASDKTITVRQERCGIASDPAIVTVPGISAMFVVLPDVIEPLFECARVVRIGAVPKAWVQIWANSPGGPAPISDQIFATSDSLRIGVSPYLGEGQEIWVSFLLCGSGNWSDSPHHWVGPRQDLGQANISVPLIEGATSVTVDAVPGAAVDVHAITGMPIKVQHIGSGFADPLVKRVGLTRPLTQKDLIYAEQWMCADRPRVGALRNVLPNLRQFNLAMPITRASTTSDPKPLVCHSALVVLRHNGLWDISAFLENQNQKADVSFHLQFTLTGLSPFGTHVEGQLSAKGSTTGLALYGIPSSGTFADQDPFAGFTDPFYWESVLNATFKFELLFVAWKDYQGYPEEPDPAEPKKKSEMEKDETP